MIVLLMPRIGFLRYGTLNECRVPNRTFDGLAEEA